MVTCNGPYEKQEHALSFTFKSVRDKPDLSENPQFQDRPGACKLIETAAKRGDQSAARRLPECRTN
jgi:hypothetical protein